MSAYILAIIIAITSIILYLSAFLSPGLHRQDDFLWSGIGLFYALVLWVCAERITGGILLGQSAAVILVVSFGWQTVRLRRVIADPENKIDLAGFSIISWIKSRLGGKKDTISSPAREIVKEAKESFTEELSQSTSKEVSTQEDTFPEAETFVQEPVEASTLIEELIEAPSEEAPESLVLEKEPSSLLLTKEPTENQIETPSEETPESLVLDEEPPSLPPKEGPTENPIGVPIGEVEPSTPVKSELKKSKKKSFFLSSLFRFRKPEPQLSSEIITESSNQEELNIDQKDWKNPGISEKLETLEEKAVIEHKVTETSEGQEELATQQAKKGNFDFLEKSQATTTSVVEGTEVTPETSEIEKPLEKEQRPPEAFIPPEEIILEGSEETPTVIADDQPQINESFTIENPQEINSDIDNLETKSSFSSSSDIFAQEKEEDKKSDKNDEKLS